MLALPFNSIYGIPGGGTNIDEALRYADDFQFHLWDSYLSSQVSLGPERLSIPFMGFCVCAAMV